LADPNDEIKVLNDKLKEQEKHIELMNVECNRWKEEAHESLLKYQTLEISHREIVISTDFAHHRQDQRH
jgi:predicted RNase H-like nuclease (RuvC/YqgF family)